MHLRCGLIGGWKVTILVIDNWLRWMICWTPWSKASRLSNFVLVFPVYVIVNVHETDENQNFLLLHVPSRRSRHLQDGRSVEELICASHQQVTYLTVKYCWTLLYCFLQKFLCLFNEQFATWTHIQSILHSSRILGPRVINKRNILQSFLIILLLHIWERITLLAIYH